MKKLIVLPLFAPLLLLTTPAFAQQLPRSASFGAMISDVNDSMRTVLRLPSPSGTLIRKVVPNSSAAKANFSANDVLVSMDDEAIQNTGHFLAIMKKHHGGDKVKIGFYRKGKRSATTMTLLPKPMETSSDYEIIYSSVVSGNNQLRTIVTRPKGGSRYPAVLLVGGVGCYSIDNIAMSELESIKMWSDSLTRRGFVTMRVEKTGMGDSKGLPCNECDFNTEKQGFLDGLKQMKSLPYVNSENVFIAGFSIGGLIAPLIAQQETVKGIIVYGTVGRNWLEYELENASRQQLLEGRPADSVDRYMREEYVRLYELFVQKKQPRDLVQSHPEMSNHLLNYPMRIEYFQQVADVNVRDLWMRTKAKVLAMHGAADFVSSAAEHRLIAETVNTYHPGNGKYMEIANCDHWGLTAETEQASFSQQQTGLNILPLTTAMAWLRANT